ncbi:MAG: hypothetical protein ACLFTR_04635 [Candidatus Woesearchaeota archaeon]
MDIILATVMFLTVASFILAYIFSGVTGDKIAELDAESRVLLSRMTSSDRMSTSPMLVMDDGKLSVKRLERFMGNMLYEESFYEDVKNELNIRNEFCIHIEDSDGNIVYPHELIQNDTIKDTLFDDTADFPDSVSAFALGSEEMTVGGKPCANEIRSSELN